MPSTPTMFEHVIIISPKAQTVNDPTINVCSKSHLTSAGFETIITL